MNRILPITLIMLIVVGGVALSQDINAQDEYGNTFLHRAVSGRSVTDVIIALSKGADVTIRNNFGRDVLTLAGQIVDRDKQRSAPNYLDSMAYQAKTLEQRIEHNKLVSEQKIGEQASEVILALLIMWMLK